MKLTHASLFSGIGGVRRRDYKFNYIKTVRIIENLDYSPGNVILQSN